MAITIGPAPVAAAQRRPLEKGPENISILEQLIPCSWRDIQFPLSGIRVSITQDLAEHKYWGVDVGRMEATGRNPMTIEATIPLFNGVVPGKNESWGTPYPDIFRQLLAAFADHSTGTLVHPELGEIPCKAVGLEFNIDPQHRDGVEVTARWIETLTENFDGALAAPATPVQTAQLAALDLDASGDDIRGLAPESPQFQETWDTMINKIAGSIDKFSTAAALTAGKPAQMFHRLETLKDSVDRARTPLLWPTTDAVSRLQCALLDIANTVTKGTRKVLRYTTQARATLPVLSGLFPGNSADDLIKLNPQLLSNPDVPANTLIRYYAP